MPERPKPDEAMVLDLYKILGLNVPSGPRRPPVKDVMRPSTGYPNVDRAIQELEQRYPKDLVGVKARVADAGPGTAAFVSRSNPRTIVMDSEMAALYGTASPDDLMAHELQHVRDFRDQDPDVMAADLNELLNGRPHDEQTLERRAEEARRMYVEGLHPGRGRISREIPIEAFIEPGIRRNTDK